MDKLKVIVPTTNGLSLKWDDFRYFLGQDVYVAGVYQAIEAMLKNYGDNFIVEGCEESGGTISEGWIMLDGELLKVDSHSKSDDFYEKVDKSGGLPSAATRVAEVGGGSTVIWDRFRGESTSASSNLKFDAERWEDVIRNKAGNPEMYSLTNTTTTVAKILTDDEGFVYIDNLQLSGASYVRLPDASKTNKGKVVFMRMSLTGDTPNAFEIQEAGASVITTLEQLDTVNYLIFKSDGTNWNMVSKIGDATFTNPGVIEIASSVEVEASAPDSAPGNIKNHRAITTKNIGNYCNREIEYAITNWNMHQASVGTDTKVISHGLGANWQNVKDIKVMIYNDADTIRTGLLGSISNGDLGGSYSIDSTNITLARTTGGFYDAIGYAGTGTRGHMIVELKQ